MRQNKIIFNLHLLLYLFSLLLIIGGRMQVVESKRKNNNFNLTDNLKALRMFEGYKHLILECHTDAQHAAIPRVLEYGGDLYSLVEWRKEFREVWFINKLELLNA